MLRRYSMSKVASIFSLRMCGISVTFHLDDVDDLVKPWLQLLDNSSVLDHFYELLLSRTTGYYTLSYRTHSTNCMHHSLP